MTNSAYVRSAMIYAALETITPPSIRDALLQESEFREEHGLTAERVLSFGDNEFTVLRGEFLSAVRAVLSGAPTEVSALNGESWSLENASNDGETTALALSRGQRRIMLPDFAGVSDDRSDRLCFLKDATDQANLPAHARDGWRQLLDERPLDDDEIVSLHDDLRDTPASVARSITTRTSAGLLGTTDLVPHSRRYFERLVGRYDGSPSIAAYAADAFRAVVTQLSDWKPYEGFLFSLLLSSHSSLADQIDTSKLDKELLLGAFDFAANSADVASQLGAIEVGLRILPQCRELEPTIVELVKQIRDDDVDGSASALKLFSALFFLVDGELARTHLLSTAPPFYRRLAALSQAALIHRQVNGSLKDVDHFSEWASAQRREDYYFQSFVDMRTEPRWSPDLGEATSLKFEFLGRIVSAGRKYESHIENTELRALLLDKTPQSLHATVPFPRQYWPGPLEGQRSAAQLPIPSEVVQELEIRLRAEQVEPSSFAALMNLSLVYSIDSKQAELAAKALELGSHHLANIKDRSQLVGTLSGLATVAAASRTKALADELRVLLRRYRRDSQYALTAMEFITICLTAAASRSEPDDWRRFVGDCMTEIAMGDLQRDEGAVVAAALNYLCDTDPELWTTCGNADAAVKAYNAS